MAPAPTMVSSMSPSPCSKLLEQRPLVIRKRDECRSRRRTDRRAGTAGCRRPRHVASWPTPGRPGLTPAGKSPSSLTRSPTRRKPPRTLTEVTLMSLAPTRRTFLKTAAGATGAALTLTRPRRSTAQTPVTVKYLTWWWAEKGRNEAWRGIVRKFHESQKDIRVQEVGFPYSEFFQRVTTQLAGGRLDADVLSFYDELGIRLIKAGVLAPVDDVVQRLGIQDRLDRQVHQFVTAGGKLYGLLA